VTPCDKALFVRCCFREVSFLYCRLFCQSETCDCRLSRVKYRSFVPISGYWDSWLQTPLSQPLALGCDVRNPHAYPLSSIKLIQAAASSACAFSSALAVGIWDKLIVPVLLGKAGNKNFQVVCLCLDVCSDRCTWLGKSISSVSHA
jgi:hypothetical protein